MFVCVGLDVFLCEVGCLLGARWVVWGGVCWLGGLGDFVEKDC